MTRTTLLHRVGEFLGVVRAAGRTASAIESNRAPAARDLKVLGIDPEAFRSIVR